MPFPCHPVPLPSVPFPFLPFQSLPLPPCRIPRPVPTRLLLTRALHAIPVNVRPVPSHPFPSSTVPYLDSHSFPRSSTCSFPVPPRSFPVFPSPTVYYRRFPSYDPDQSRPFILVPNHRCPPIHSYCTTHITLIRMCVTHTSAHESSMHRHILHSHDISMRQACATPEFTPHVTHTSSLNHACAIKCVTI